MNLKKIFTAVDLDPDPDPDLVLALDLDRLGIAAAKPVQPA
ncbi:hypothetical protein GCM10023310_46430 [Paenibacillus vulneris]